MAAPSAMEARDSYLRCTYRGPFELAPLLDLMRDLRRYCTEHGHRRVLVDVRQSPGTLTPLARYQHAVEMAKPGGIGARTVVLARPDQVLPDRFWETATRNRGLATRVATTEDEAQAWLAMNDS